MTTATQKTTGFDVCCPHCGNDNATVTIDLNTLECECRECETSFTVDEAVQVTRDQAAKWAAVERWVALIPQAKGE